MNSRTRPAPAPLQHTDAIEGQFALRVAAHLHRGAEALPHDLAERLRFAREQALARARSARGAGVAHSIQAIAQGTATLAGPPSLWLRLASVMPLLLLVLGLLLIQQQQTVEQIRVAAEIDTALLGDALPPAAYGDPGFSEFLRDVVMP